MKSIFITQTLIEFNFLNQNVMMAAKRWRLLWSEDSYILSEVVRDLGTPVMVKVDKSIYELNDERFNSGDVLQIHEKRSIRKVVGSIVEGTKTTSSPHSPQAIANDISIPIGYKQKLTIKRRDAGHKVYQNVQQLANELPRRVRLIEDTTDRRGCIIKAKSDVEIIGTEEGVGLVCLFDGYKYTLDLDQQMKCLLLPDKTLYTVQDMIDRYSLPQIVSFASTESPNLGMNPYTGMKDISLCGKCVKVKRLVQQDIFICTLNPSSKSTAPTQTAGKPVTAMVAIPTDSVTTSQMQVKIPQQPEDSTYGVVLSMTVPETDATISVIEETIDTVNYPNVLFVLNNNTPTKKVPQVPPRNVKRVPPKPLPKTSRPNKSEQASGSDEDYEFVGPQILPTNLHTNDNQQKPQTSKKPPPSVEEVDRTSRYGGATSNQGNQDIRHEEENDHIYDIIKEDTLPQSKQPAGRSRSEADADENIISKLNVPQKVREGLLRVQDELLSLKLKLKGSPSVKDPEDNQSLSETKPKKQRPQSFCVGSKTKKGDDTKVTAKLGKRSKEFFREAMQKMMSGKSTQHMSPLQRFASLNTCDLVEYLRRCGLNKMAEIVKEEGLDGQFFISVNEEDLKNTFGLNSIQLVKFKQMRDSGWEPNTKV
ncbi:uncharacterized protein [Argopecten irradians]|uniref:uncharacterized protein isoform X2 n=1 Tax=Argopecten irradians TaxID=31199 RepID=UPI003716F123